MFSEKDLRSLFDEDTIRYLKNKHTGGSSNHKGNTYENHFAIYQLAHYAKDVIEQGLDIKVYSQVLSFVDDLFIHHPDTPQLRHFQLKSGSSVSWGKGSRSISEDFNNQKLLNDSKQKTSQLSLVVACPNLKINLQQVIPSNLSSFSHVLFFPFDLSLPKVLEAEPRFKQVVEYLCAIENPTKDKLEAVAGVLLGAWVSSAKSGASILDILENARQLNPSFIRILKGPVPTLDPNVKKILDSIPNFGYSLSKGVFHWDYGQGIQSGTFLYSCDMKEFRRFQDRVKKNKPASFDELEPDL